MKKPAKRALLVLTLVKGAFLLLGLMVTSCSKRQPPSPGDSDPGLPSDEPAKMAPNPTLKPATLPSGWLAPVNLGSPVNSKDRSEKGPDVSADGLEVYYHVEDRKSAVRRTDANDRAPRSPLGLWRSIRNSPEEKFGAPELLVDANTGEPLVGAQPDISFDKKTLFYTSHRRNDDGNRLQIHFAIRDSKAPAGNRWYPQGRVLGEVNHPKRQVRDACISRDGHRLYYAAKAIDAAPEETPFYRIVYSNRNSSTDHFGSPVILSDLEDPFIDTLAPDLSPDGNSMVFCRIKVDLTKEKSPGRPKIDAEGIYISVRGKKEESRWESPIMIMGAQDPPGFPRSPCFGGSTELVIFRSYHKNFHGAPDLWSISHP